MSSSLPAPGTWASSSRPSTSSSSYYNGRMLANSSTSSSQTAAGPATSSKPPRKTKPQAGPEPDKPNNRRRPHKNNACHECRKSHVECSDAKDRPCPRCIARKLQCIPSPDGDGRRKRGGGPPKPDREETLRAPYRPSATPMSSASSAAPSPAHPTNWLPSPVSGSDRHLQPSALPSSSTVVDLHTELRAVFSSVLGSAHQVDGLLQRVHPTTSNDNTLSELSAYFEEAQKWADALNALQILKAHLGNRVETLIDRLDAGLPAPNAFPPIPSPSTAAFQPIIPPHSAAAQSSSSKRSTAHRAAIVRQTRQALNIALQHPHYYSSDASSPAYPTPDSMQPGWLTSSESVASYSTHPSPSEEFLSPARSTFGIYDVPQPSPGSLNSRRSSVASTRSPLRYSPYHAEVALPAESPIAPSPGWSDSLDVTHSPVSRNFPHNPMSGKRGRTPLNQAFSSAAPPQFIGTPSPYLRTFSDLGGSPAYASLPEVSAGDLYADLGSSAQGTDQLQSPTNMSMTDSWVGAIGICGHLPLAYDGDGQASTQYSNQPFQGGAYYQGYEQTYGHLASPDQYNLPLNNDSADNGYDDDEVLQHPPQKPTRSPSNEAPSITVIQPSPPTEQAPPSPTRPDPNDDDPWCAAYGGDADPDELLREREAAYRPGSPFDLTGEELFPLQEGSTAFSPFLTGANTHLSEPGLYDDLALNLNLGQIGASGCLEYGEG